MVSKRGSQSPPRKSSSPSRGASESPTRSPSKRSRSPSTKAKPNSSNTNGTGASPFGLQTPSPRRIETNTSGRENVSPLRRRAPSSSPPKGPTNEDWSDTANQPSENGNAFATPQRGRRVSREHHVRTVSPLKKSAESNRVVTPSGDWDDDVEAKEQSVAEALQTNERAGPSSPPAAGTIQNAFGSSPLTPRSIAMATKNLSDSPLKPGASPTAAPVDWEEKIAKAQEDERKAEASRGDGGGGRKNKRKAGDDESETEDGDAKRVKDGEGKVVYSVVDKDTENVTIAHGAEDRNNKCRLM